MPEDESIFRGIKDKVVGGTPKELVVNQTYVTTKPIKELDFVLLDKDSGVVYGMEHKREADFEQYERLNLVLTPVAQAREDKRKEDWEKRMRDIPHVKSDPHDSTPRYRRRSQWKSPSLSLASETKITSVAVEKQDDFDRRYKLPMVAMKVKSNVGNVRVYPGGYDDVTQSFAMSDIVTIDGIPPQKFMDQQLVAVRASKETLDSLNKPPVINIFRIR